MFPADARPFVFAVTFQDNKGLNANYSSTADRREFLKISQAVGMGFLVMGAIGYFIKLSTSNLSPSVSLDCFGNA